MSHTHSHTHTHTRMPSIAVNYDNNGNSYCQCTPTRSSLLTGYYSSSIGMQHDCITSSDPFGKIQLTYVTLLHRTDSYIDVSLMMVDRVLMPMMREGDNKKMFWHPHKCSSPFFFFFLFFFLFCFYCVLFCELFFLFPR